MNKMYFVFLICLQMTQITNAVSRVLLYVRSSESTSLSGLGCALEKLHTERARGARFNPQTKACEALLETWFSNKVEETDFDYFKLKAIEDVFAPRNWAPLDLPTSIVRGYQFAIRFNSGTDMCLFDPNAGAQVKISLTEGDSQPFHMRIRPYTDDVIFNDGGSISNPMTLPNTTYTLEGQVNPTHITFSTAVHMRRADNSIKHTFPGVMLFMDGVLIYEFAHTTDLSNYDGFSYFGKREAKILQFIQYYPD